MPERKKQHYVPKLYLRQFSINGNNNQIGLFYLPKELYQRNVPLKNQAKEDYFYGEDGFLEEELSKHEASAAPSLKNIITTNKIPRKDEDEYIKLFTFCIVMANRTKDSAEKMNEITDKFMREIMSYDDRLKGKLDDIRIHQKNPAALTLFAALERLPLALDLKMKLLINRTEQPFITSDNPVVSYNQFLEQRQHPGGHTGLLIKGLQILFPISSTQMLCLYDDQVYKIGNRNQDIVEIKSKNDVDNLVGSPFLVQVKSRLFYT